MTLFAFYLHCKMKNEKSMSGLASSATLAFAPVFVVQFGSRHNNNRRRKKKLRQDYNNNGRNWHVYDSLLAIPSALSSSFSFFLLIFLVILCSIGSDDGVKGSEISSSSMALSNSYSSNGVPTFDINDLRNLIEIFPEFREYVFRVVSNQIEKQQHNQYGSGDYVATTTTAKVPTWISIPTLGSNFYDGGNSPNSRKDLFTYSDQKDTHSSGQKTAVMTKHSYGWPHYDSYHNHHDPDSHHHGYGYKQHAHYGWNSEPSHHEADKDPKFHYEVGYQLGKDLSCLFGILGFKSIKDFSVYSFFSILKKIKYFVLIGLAFKLGVLLSPIALPLLVPVIILSVIAKILPLLLIIVLLFKLLKTQIKLGIGKRNGEISGSESSRAFSLLDDTGISRLWKSIDDVTQAVADSESCVEKIICKMIQAKRNDSSTSLLFYEKELYDENAPNEVTKKSPKTAFTETNGILPGFVSTLVNWAFPKKKWKFTGGVLSNIWECDKIQCNVIAKS